MEEKEYTIDLAEALEIVKENRKPIVRMTGLFVIMVSAFLLIALFFFPRYTSETVLQVKQKSSLSGAGALAALSGGDFLNVGGSGKATYEEIIKSRSVVIPVIEATEEPEGLFEKKYPRYETYVKKRIATDDIKLTEILKVKVNAETPEKAQQVNKLLLESFFKRLAELNSVQKGTLKNFLTERVKTAKVDLDKAENALQQYKVEHKILNPTANAEMFAERLAGAEKAAVANQIELEAAEARMTAVNSQLSGSGSSAADNVTLQKYNSELAGLESTLIVYKERYTDKHPKMIDLKERIASLKGKILEEQDRIAALQAPSDNMVHQGLVAGKYSSEAAVKVLRQKREALQREIEHNNAELEKLPEVEKGYVRLARDHKVASEIYMFLTKRLEETKITEFQEPTNVLVIDAPTFPNSRSFPALKLSLALAIIFGFLLSSGYVVIKELMHKTVRSIEDVKQNLGLPVLGTLPNEVVLPQSMEAVQKLNEPAWSDKLKEFIWKE